MSLPHGSVSETPEPRAGVSHCHLAGCRVARVSESPEPQTPPGWTPLGLGTITAGAKPAQSCFLSEIHKRAYNPLVPFLLTHRETCTAPNTTLTEVMGPTHGVQGPLAAQLPRSQLRWADTGLSSRDMRKKCAACPNTDPKPGFSTKPLRGCEGLG